jgi:EamA domain-containing membrane protein RarD
MLARNGGLYLLGIPSDRVVETSFGDDLHPLVNVC